MHKIIIKTEAAVEYKNSINWYESESPGLGNSLLVAVETTLLNIRLNPKRYPIRKKEFREAIVPHFPFTITYVIKGATIFVTAIFHMSRNPNKKYRKP